MFDAAIALPDGRKVTTANSVTIDGSNITINRTASSDGVLRTYTGISWEQNCPAPLRAPATAPVNGRLQFVSRLLSPRELWAMLEQERASMQFGRISTVGYPLSVRCPGVGHCLGSYAADGHSKPLGCGR